MPTLALLAPIALPLAASAITVAGGLAGLKPGRAIVGAGAWAALAALLVVWLSVRSTQELNLGPLGFGAGLDLRVDGVAFAFGLTVLLPSAILLSLQPRTWQEGTVAALGVAAAMLAIEGGGVLLTALAGGTAATLAVIHLDIEDVRAPRPPWGMLLAAWLALSWAGASLQVLGGTAVYAAVPGSALTVPVFSLLAAAALMASGLFPWRGWVAQLWSRPSLRAAGMAVATLYPLGFYLLVRAYELGGGRYPQPLLGVALSSWGVLVAFGAAMRAQSAATRREYLAEVIPGFGGFALMAVALGTPVGLVAGLVTLATAGVLAACLPLLPDKAGPASLLTIAAAMGLPPGLAFGARVVGLEATFEAGEFFGLIGIAGAATWVVSMVAAARAIGLPAGRGHPASETFPSVAMALAALTLVAGPALALVQSAFASPAQANVMPLPQGSPTGGLTSVLTVSTVLPAVTLFIPLLVLGALAYAAAGGFNIRAGARPALFATPGAAAIGRLLAQVRAAAVPDEYRSIFNPRAIELAAAGGQPFMWLAAVAALAYAVTR
ncbi:MAG TPA: hypothetical protein VGU71_17025 [Candidatus Dormibacteraeota bacterium]|nr:hypothetical protein [Candidatus Dormibacteraeota bacterium]